MSHSINLGAAAPASPELGPASGRHPATSHPLNAALRQALADAAQAATDATEAHAMLTTQDIGRAEIVWARSGSLDLQIDPGDAAPRVSALIVHRGRALIRQGAAATELDVGDLCLIRDASPLELGLDGPCELTLVHVPEQEFAERFPLWRWALAKRIRAAAGAPAVFLDALGSLQRWRETLGHGSQEGLANALIDLMGAVVCFAVPDDTGCVLRSLYQRERVKGFAQRNLQNPDLNVELIAEAVNLSPRQVHRLFARESVSLMRWVWIQRLENCHRELRNASTAKRTISDIAYAWGFNDQAHFSRAFRKHFGVSPREVRRRQASRAAATTAAG